MILLGNIEKAFGDTLKPKVLVQRTPTTLDPDDRDALWFDFRDWRDISWRDWEDHRGAFSAFSPEAFVYYLPSILCNSIRHPSNWFEPADSIIQILDRSPVVDYWDEFLVARLVGLRTDQYEVIKQWLLLLADSQDTYNQESLGRAFDTVCLLQTSGCALK